MAGDIGTLGGGVGGIGEAKLFHAEGFVNLLGLGGMTRVGSEFCPDREPPDIRFDPVDLLVFDARRKVLLWYSLSSSETSYNSSKSVARVPKLSRVHGIDACENSLSAADDGSEAS